MDGVNMFSIRTLIIQISIIQSAISLLSFSQGSFIVQGLENSKSVTVKEGLYQPDDDIETLTADNFANELYNKDHAWIINFYLNWCGHCKRFAPEWKALGTDTRAWSDLIKFGAIDCAGVENKKICKKFELRSYPTLLYFHENYGENHKNSKLNVLMGKDMQETKQYILDTIISEQSSSRALQFPDLQATTFRNISKIRNSVSQDAKYVFLIFQEMGSYSGREIMLDFHKAKQIAIIYSLNNNTDLLTNVGLTEDDLPAIVVITEEGPYEILGQSYGNKKQMEKAIRNYSETKGIHLPDIPPSPKNSTKPQPDMESTLQELEKYALLQWVKQTGDAVFQVDLEAALKYSLEYEVTSTSHVSGEKLDALKAYLNVLVKYFPLSHRGEKMLKAIRDSVESSNSTFETSEIGDRLIAAETEGKQVFSSPQGWLGCQGSLSQYRGYPCGLWKMFHYLTVNAAEHNTNSSESPREVLDAMHGYIIHFFTCEHCVTHFRSMASRRNISSVQSYDSAILWLWDAHNEVNLRLAGDETEDPEFPKYEFPSKERCPLCRMSYGSWYLPEVLRYLKHMYMSENVRYIGHNLHKDSQEISTAPGTTRISRDIATRTLPKRDVSIRPFGRALTDRVL